MRIHARYIMNFNVAQLSKALLNVKGEYLFHAIGSEKNLHTIFIYLKNTCDKVPRVKRSTHVGNDKEEHS